MWDIVMNTLGHWPTTIFGLSLSTGDGKNTKVDVEGDWTALHDWVQLEVGRPEANPEALDCC